MEPDVMTWLTLLPRWRPSETGTATAVQAEAEIVYSPDGPLEGGNLVSADQTMASFRGLNSSLATCKQDR